ncbi:MAG: hypothetical protein BWY92_01665 [Firmicutes bacterium ADurb.BinA052]|nr:MAG: hypothetical protein BWY92_01665 [Firmicutes bacterium ADurb.BinA052]
MASFDSGLALPRVGIAMARSPATLTIRNMAGQMFQEANMVWVTGTTFPVSLSMWLAGLPAVAMVRGVEPDMPMCHVRKPAYAAAMSSG